MQCIQKKVTEEQNKDLEQMPTIEELDKVIMHMNPNSAPGADGFGGRFFQTCFDIIKHDLLAAVTYFFNGYEMPKYMHAWS